MCTVSTLLGQHPLPLPLARQVVELLELPQESVPVLAAVPHRGTQVSVPPTDPTIYRFYEALAV